MNIDTAQRLTALFARKTDEGTAEKIVEMIMKQLSSRKAEPTSERRADTDRGPLANPSSGASKALLEGMKSEGEVLPEPEFERFIGAGGSVELAQTSLPGNSANRALIDLTNAFQSMSPENRAAYYQRIRYTDSEGREAEVAPYHYLKDLQSVGSSQLMMLERDGDLVVNNDEIIKLTGDIRKLFAEPEAAPDQLLKLVIDLHTALNVGTGHADIFNP